MSLADELSRFDGSSLEEADELTALSAMLSGLKASDLEALALSILGDSSKLDAATRFAYRHVNGFSKVTLLRTPSLCLRVHVWNGIDAPAENVHSHKWAFASRVIAGRVAESRYRLEAETEQRTATEYQYAKLKDELTGKLIPVRDVALSPSDLIEHEESSLYTATTSDIHRVHAQNHDAGDLISLVLTGRSRLATSSVYAQQGNLPIPDRADAALTRDETADLLNVVRALAK